MKVIDCSHVAGLTLLALSEELPKKSWRHVIIGGKIYEPLIPMYAGDIFHAKNNSIGIRGEHDFIDKEVEFV